MKMKRGVAKYFSGARTRWLERKGTVENFHESQLVRATEKKTEEKVLDDLLAGCISHSSLADILVIDTTLQVDCG